MANQQLPQAEAQYLQGLHADKRRLPLLRHRVQQLRSQGWTLRAIGEPLKARRSTVRSWENHPDATPAPDNETSPPLPTPPNIRPAPVLTSRARPHVRALAPDVPRDDQDRIRNLAPLARKVRGGTPPSSPARAAKRELDDLVAYYADRGVPVQRLAELAGVSYRAMNVRLQEHAATRTRASAAL